MVLGYKIQLYTGKHLHVLSYFAMGFGRDGGSMLKALTTT